MRVPRRAYYVGDAEEDGRAGAHGGEEGRRRRGRRGGRRRPEEEGGVETVSLLLLRVLSLRDKSTTPKIKHCSIGCLYFWPRRRLGSSQLGLDRLPASFEGSSSCS
uniref:Uncharacterized protein n=1 Tax=Oryza punctata TaxID=4537 RepID=A0A0E0KJC7_ORYPU